MVRHFKKYFILLLAALGPGFSASAQVVWTVQPSQYEFSMTVTAVLNLDGKLSLDGNDRVGAFIGETCRGVANPSQYTTADGSKIVFLQVYSNTILGEAVTFKMFDASTGILVNAANKLTFQSDANTGNMAAPYIITTNQNPTDIALSSAEIMEGKEAGSEVGIFTATDPDKGADADYSYKLIAGAADNTNFSVLKDSLISAVIFDYDLKSTHTILVEVSDGKGGTFQKQMTINIAVDPNQFSANNYISPNGDLKNDFWMIKNIEVYKEHQITIYNDAGIVVFSKKGYNNDWDGTYEGKKLPTGVYYFIVKSPDNGRKFTGSISLNR